jgi:hydroxyacylglutathione hydrolase
VPPGQPIVLVGDDQRLLEEGVHALGHVGFNDIDVARFENGGTASYQVATFADLAEQLTHGKPIQLVDAREHNEWEAGHLASAALAPFHSVESIAAVTPDIPIWIHCAKGYRAAIGASVLDRLGREVVLIDDDFGAASAAGHLVVVV